MIRTHWGQHSADCLGCKLSTLQFGPASEEKRSELKQRLGTEAQLFGKDRDAYYRVRSMHGIQPKSIRGCAELEAVAELPREFEEGRRISKQAWREGGNRVQEVEAMVRESSLQPNSDQAKELGERFRHYAKEEGLAPSS